MTNARTYSPTLHAVERARVRFGIQAEHARNWFNQIMASAIFVTENGSGQYIYEHKGKHIVVDGDRIITIKPTEDSDGTLSSKVKSLVERELRKATAQHRKTVRGLTIELSELNFEIARLALNQAKARSPKVRELIQRKIDEVKAQCNAVAESIQRADDFFESFRRGAKSYGKVDV